MPSPVVSVVHASTLTAAVVSSCASLKLPIITKTSNRKKKASVIMHGTTDTDEYYSDAVSLTPRTKLGKIAGGHECAKKHTLASVFSRCSAVLTSSGSSDQRPSPVDEFWPKTFVLPSEQEGAMAALERNRKRKGEKKKTFILKPSSGSQGEGILLLQEPTTMGATSLMWSARRNYVMQEYIPNPHIVSAECPYKWDMRVYVTVASLEPLQLLLHKEGLVRFCTTEYRRPARENLMDTMSHLTNYSLNKRSENYVNAAAAGPSSAADDGGADDSDEAGEGSKRALSDVLRCLPGFLPEGLTESGLYDRLASLSYYTMTAMLPLLKTHKYVVKAKNETLLTNSFQTFGLDVLVDAAGKCWLLEVNSNPSMRLDHEGEKSPVDEKVKGSVMDGVMRTVAGKGGEDGGGSGDRKSYDDVIDISSPVAGTTDPRWGDYESLFDGISVVYRHLFAGAGGGTKTILLTLIIFRKLMKLLKKERETHIYDLVHQRFVQQWREARDREDAQEFQEDFNVMDLYDLLYTLKGSAGFRDDEEATVEGLVAAIVEGIAAAAAES